MTEMKVTIKTQILQVRIGVLLGKINDYTITEGTTIDQLCENTGINNSGYDATKDGLNIKMSYVLEEGDLILLAPRHKNG